MLPSVLMSLFMNSVPVAAKTADEISFDWVAREDPEALDHITKGYVLSGPIAEFKAGLVSYGKTSKQLIMLAALEDQLAGADRDVFAAAEKTGAFASPVQTRDRYYLYDDRVVFHFVTRIDVKDPDVLASFVGKEYGLGSPMDAKDCQDLDKNEQTMLQDVIDEPGAYLSTLPGMAAPLASGDPAEVCAAMFSGVGEHTVSATAVVYLADQTLVDADDTLLDTWKTFSAVYDRYPFEPFVEEPPISYALGSTLQRTPLVFGWAEDASIEKEKRWGFRYGFVRISFGIVARLGIRFPYEQTVEMSPRLIVGDEDASVYHEISIEPVDGSSTFYENAGLEGWSGDEGTMVLRAWFGAKVRAIKRTWVHIRSPDANDRSRGGDCVWDLVNQGTSFTSPLDGRTVSYPLELPGSMTGLQVSAGVLEAGVDLRLNFALSGDRIDSRVQLRGQQSPRLEEGTGTLHDGYVMARHEDTLPTVFRATQTAAYQRYGYAFVGSSLYASASVRPGIRGYATVPLKRIWRRLPNLSKTTAWFEPVEIHLDTATVPVMGDIDRIEQLMGKRIPSNHPEYEYYTTSDD
ncbi:MAG: hypothetical protein AAFV53_00070 [Myxococcota bacterium]